MSVMYWIEKGGPILVILLALNLVGWSLLIWKFLQVVQFFKALEDHTAKVKQRLSEFDFTGLSMSGSERLDYVVSFYMDRMHRGLSTIRVIATVSPLLGLLGTVFGILMAFQTISEKGLDDPSLFASGIALALITTVAGLIVAIPHFIGYNYLSSSLGRAERQLEESLLKSKDVVEELGHAPA